MLARQSLRRVAQSLPSSSRSFASSSATREHYLDATPEVFRKAISSSKTVIVDFTATWCPPCKVLGPIIKTVIPPNSERADLVTVDVDDQAELAAEYKIRAMPTVMAFRDSKPVGQFVGLKQADGINAFLDEVKA